MQLTERLGSTHYSFDVLGVRFNQVSRNVAVEQILHWMNEKSRRMVITAGPEFVMKAQHDATLRKMAFVADMVTPDGIGVVWAARRRGIQSVERVTGVELVESLLDTAKERNLCLRIFVLGASEISLNKCLQAFRRKYPNMTFTGHHGYFSADELGAIRSEIEVFDPDLWLVGLGQPRQEKLIFDSLAGLPPCVGIGVGGSIDVWGGSVPRAPKFVQKIHLEWLYRLVKEPTRLRRQMALPKFAWKILRSNGRNMQ